MPLSTLRHALAGHRRITRGRRGSLALRRRALPSPPPCRFIPALLRAGPPLCLASVLSPTWPWPPGVLPLDDQGADITHFDWPFVSRRQILLFHARACNELTPPLHRTPPGPRAGSSLAPDTPTGAPFSRGRHAAPVSMSSFTFTMRQQWFTHVRLLVAYLTRWLRAFSAVASHPGS